MDARAILNAIGTLLEGMPGADARQRLVNYAAIRALSQDLEESDKLCQYATGHTAQLISELLEHCRRWAGLTGDEGGGAEEVGRARHLLDELRSGACFVE
jgi:hypothetical protein